MRTALLLCLVLATAGCGTASVVAGTTGPVGVAPSTAPQQSDPVPYDGCPAPKPVPSGASMAVDYADFVDANGDEYVGMPATLGLADRGDLQLRVLCSISEWSDKYHQTTDGRDGDAAFLPAGTAVYAVKGSSPLCRLMAKSDDGWHLYAATQNPACHGSAAPVATALPSKPAIDNSLADCPTLTPKKPGEGVSVDYGDFVQAHGTSYVDDYRLRVNDTDKGPLQFRVRCALGHLNDVTHLASPAARDGDAAFLPAGTPVYAVKGFSTACRLMATNTDAWVVYTPRPTPAGCPAIPG